MLGANTPTKVPINPERVVGTVFASTSKDITDNNDLVNPEKFSGKKLQIYETGITPVYGDKIICLSTCEYTRDNGRLVVAAVRIS